ncbi:DUF7837 family putative zinc-binding protein [Halobacterium salinarum]
MPSTNSRLGDCPRCGASIHDRHILVAYGPDKSHCGNIRRFTQNEGWGDVDTLTPTRGG